MFGRLAVLVAFALPFALPAPAVAGSVLDRVRDAGILVGAADPSWPPYSWRDPIGEYHGFDVDVTRAIADRLGARAAFVAAPWEAQVAGGWDGAWDIAVTSMTPTADRAARLDFPAVYAWSEAALAAPVHRTDIAAPEDASGLRIAVIEDTIFARYLRHEDLGIVGLGAVDFRIEPGEIVAFADSAAPYRTVVAGEIVDALVDDLTAIEAQIAQGRPIRVVGDPLFAAPVAVAIDKGDPAFAAEIARTVETLREDGTLARLERRWFGEVRTAGAGD